jgi:8-oxo-dGTP diphosphatase
VKNHELPPKAAIWAAGGIVYRVADDGRAEYLLIHRPRYDDWSLPKGKLDRGESFAEGARREVREETGSKGKLGPYVGTISYETAAGNQKVVRYWLLEHGTGSFKRNAEVDAVSWLSRGKAMRRLTYERDRGVLQRGHELVKNPARSRVYLVRHAEAGKRSEWSKDDRSRPLSKNGRKQTSALHDLLIEGPITGISSSPYLRCRQTVAGLGKTLGIKVTEEEALEESSPPEKLVKRLRSLSGESIVMCSHGDVISGTVGMLAAEGVDLDGPREWKKGSIWVLEVNGGRVKAGRYLPLPL